MGCLRLRVTRLDLADGAEALRYSLARALFHIVRERTVASGVEQCDATLEGRTDHRGTLLQSTGQP